MGDFTLINVKQGGAFGDGHTDDTTAINNGLAAVPVNNPGTGATVYFPRGVYLISSQLIRTVSFTRCVGEGKDATTILLDPFIGMARYRMPTQPDPLCSS